jgi:DNA polymerase-3 subunit epsilon
MMLIRGGDHAPTGYILTLTDVTSDIAELNRRDRLLRAATTGLRAPLANLRAAAETLGAFPDIEPGQRREFEQVMLREAEALARHVEMIDREGRDLAATQWSFADIHSVDLLNCVIRRMSDAGGPALTMVGLPLWLHGDSHALVVAVQRLASKLAAGTGCRQFDVEALLGDRRVYLEIAWEGRPVPESTIDSWLAEPLPEALGGPTLGDVLARHGSEIWSRSQEARAGRPMRAVLRLPLPAPTRAQFQPPAAPKPARPEFYDFELMHLATADGGLEARPLRSVPYVVFDTETTGLNPSQGDEIISIGAVRIVSGRILTGETFARLINPGRAIPRESIKFHNITDAMVADAPPAAVALPQFRAFAGDSVLVAHNAAFDLKFLRLKEQDCGVRFNMMALDTLLISVFLYPELHAHDFDAIAQRLGVEISGRHSALGDALATAGVFVRLLDLLETRGITTLGDLMKASNMALAIRLRQEQF